MDTKLSAGHSRRKLPLLNESNAPTLAPRVRRRHLCLLSLDWTRDKDPRVPLGHASLVAALREADAAELTAISVPMNVADFSIENVLQQLLDAIRLHPQYETCVGFGVYVWNDHLVRALINELRRHGFGGLIILGGPQISYSEPGLEQFYPEADVFIRGYAERALAQLVAEPVRTQIPGVHWAGEVDRQELAKPQLSALPSPFLGKIIDLSAQRFVRWETQRGCPYRCSFCQHREPGARMAQRERGLDQERLRAEIALFINSGVSDIAVLDPIFNSGPNYLAILREFQRLKYRGRLSLQCRFESVREDFFDACDGLDVRLEFGLQTIHKKEGKAIHRENDMDRVDEVLHELRRRRIHFEVSVIFGLPEQTLRSFQETVEYCLRNRVPTIRAFPLMLLRGTELQRDRNRYGLIENSDVIPAVVASETFSQEDWETMRAIAAALDKTCGEHPTSLRALLELSARQSAQPSPVYSPAHP